MAKFYKSLQKLSDAGFKVAVSRDEQTKEDVKVKYERYVSNIDRVQSKLEQLQNEIDYKQRRIDNMEWEINLHNRRMTRSSNEKSFLTDIFSEYNRNQRDRIKRLNQIKKRTNKEIKAQYKKIKREETKFNEAQKELKKFEKFVKKTAKKRKSEIKFILYCQKHNDKLEKAYTEEQMTELREYIKRLQLGEKGYEDVSVKKCYKEVKNAVKTQRRFFAKSEIPSSIFASKSRERQENNQEELHNEETRNSQNEQTSENVVNFNARKQQREFRNMMRQNVVFANSSIDRESLQKALNQMQNSTNSQQINALMSSKVAPEKIAFAIGVVADMDSQIEIILDALESNNLSDKYTKNIDHFTKQGVKILEEMQNSNKQNVTKAEEAAKQIMTLYRQAEDEQQTVTREARMNQRSER